MTEPGHYEDDLEPTFGEHIVGPPLALKVRRWLQREYDQLIPLADCYTRVAERIFSEGVELDVLDWYAAAVATSPREVFERLGAMELLWGFWKPAGWKPSRRRR